MFIGESGTGVTLVKRNKHHIDVMVPIGAAKMRARFSIADQAFDKQTSRLLLKAGKFWSTKILCQKLVS